MSVVSKGNLSSESRASQFRDNWRYVVVCRYSTVLTLDIILKVLMSKYKIEF